MTANRVCPKCGYDATPPTAQSCEICAERLDRSTGRGQSVGFWSVAFIGGVGLIAGGFLLLRGVGAVLPTPGQTRPVTLRASADSWAGYFLLRQGSDPKSVFGRALERRGIALTYDDEPDQGKRADKLADGTYELAMTSADQMLLNPFKGSIVAMVDVSDGGDAVVLQKGLQSIDDIKPGMKVAYASTTPSETLLRTLALRFRAVDLKQLKPVPVMVADEAWALLKGGKVDVAVVWQPFTGLALQAGYRVALSSADAKNVILDVLLASAQADPQSVRQFVGAYCEVLDYYSARPEELRLAIGIDSGVKDQAQLAELSAGIQFIPCSEAEGTWFAGGLFERRQAVLEAIVGVKPAGKLFDLTALQTYTGADEERRRTVASLDPALVAPAAPPKASPSFAPLRLQEAITRPLVGSLRVSSIGFNVNSARLTPGGLRTLEDFRPALDDFPQLRVMVAGHSSRRGDLAFNQALSQARAAAVVKFFVSKGYAPGRFVAIGYGSSRPLKGVSPALSINQRTEIKLFR